LQGEVLAAQVAYWRERLAGAPGMLELPTDRLRPPAQGSRGGRTRLEVGAGRAAAWRALGRSLGCTPFMTLLAAWAVLLHRYSGQETVVVGTPTANRDREEIENLIGLFANTLALRTDLGDDPAFHTLLGRVRESALAAYTHRDLPFEKLVEELRPQRDASHAPIFQVLLVHQGMPARTARPGGLEIRPFAGEEGIARFDLTLVSAERHDGSTLLLDYDADLFERVTMERHLRLFAHLLDAAAESPAMAVSSLPLLDEEERRQVVSVWNDTELRFADAGSGLHELFRRWARRTPGAVAVRGDGEVWTFGELADWAGRVADRLRRLGVGPEMRVGVCLERSAAALAALLGVLEAGGAYVPLDPEWPRERLSAILGDSEAGVVLTSRRLAGVLSGLAVEPVLVEPGEVAPGDGPGEVEAAPRRSGQLRARALRAARP
jgi:non-ribosomal peptide synthetase component F